MTESNNLTNTNISENEERYGSISFHTKWPPGPEEQLPVSRRRTASEIPENSCKR